MGDRFKFRYVWKHKDSGDVKLVTHSFQTIESTNPILVMQMDGYRLINRDFSTDLKDKNGKLIFEGDIIQWTTTFNKTSNAIHKDVVTWCNATACYLLMPWCHELHGSSMEIIGNIHENMELLEKN